MASRNAQCATRDQAILSRNSTNTLDNVPNTLALGHIGHTVTGKRYLNQFPDTLRGDHISPYTKMSSEEFSSDVSEQSDINPMPDIQVS